MVLQFPLCFYQSFGSSKVKIIVNVAKLTEEVYDYVVLVVT